MRPTMQERFEIAKAQQLVRSQQVEKITRKKAAPPQPMETEKRSDTHRRKKHREYLMTMKNLKCGICEKDFTENTRFLHLDHCHTTGDIRGLLCHNCNIGLGCFKDSTKFLEAAIEYLLRVDRKTKDKIKAAVHPSWTTPIESKPFEKPNNWWWQLGDLMFEKEG